MQKLLGFPGSSVGKESACNAGDPGSIPRLGRSPGGGIGYPLQYSWASLVAQLVKSLQCKRPGLDPWVGKIPWRKEQLPTPVFWPGEFHGLYSPWGHKESDTTEQLSLFHLAWPKISFGFKVKLKDTFFIFTKNLYEQPVRRFVPLPSAVFQATS